MLLSIIIPAYNAEKFIRNCIESIMSQKFKDDAYEIILVNDGSTDNTEKICLQLQNEIPAIKYFFKTNSGPAHTRNFGLANAMGEYVWFIDADDYLVPNSVYQFIEDIDNQLDMYIIGFQKVKENNSIISKRTFPNQIISPTEALKKKYYLNQVWCKLIKRSVLKEHNIMFREDVRGPEDFHFSFRLLSLVKRIKTIDVICYNYIRNPSSLMRVRTNTHLENLANYSVLVGNDLKMFIQSLDEEEKNLFNKWLNNYLFGLFFSLFRYNYDIKFINNIIKELKSANNYPINTTGMNLKQKLFMSISNRKSLFLNACRFNRLIKS